MVNIRTWWCKLQIYVIQKIRKNMRTFGCTSYTLSREIKNKKNQSIKRGFNWTFEDIFNCLIVITQF